VDPNPGVVSCNEQVGGEGQGPLLVVVEAGLRKGWKS